MGRPVVLSNGSLFVGLNEQGLVHDFYYPYVGLDNLTTARSVHHKVGVWVDGTFSWVDDGSWEVSVDFESTALVSKVIMKHSDLGITLSFQDFVDHEFNAFCRMVTISNQHDDEREVRLFMHQVFQISPAGRGDTALIEPDEHYIFDYKGRCSLLIYGQTDTQIPFDQFAIGSYGIEGKEGTFRDAEDGELSNNPVEHGGVDSVIRLTYKLQSQQAVHADYWIVASDTQYNAQRIHRHILRDGLADRLSATRDYWKEWLSISAPHLETINPDYLDTVHKCLLIVKAHIDKRGGIIASGDSSIYNYGRDYYSYVWPRDGAYALWPLIRLGYQDEAKRFFEFCRDVMHPDGYMMHKYQPDRAIGSTWHPLLHGDHTELAIQEDESAIVLYMLGEYHRLSHDTDFVKKLYETLVRPLANFMTSYIDQETGLPHASYDLWEQRFLTDTYTVAVTYQALLTASELAQLCEQPHDEVVWKRAAQDLLDKSSQLINPETHMFRKGFLLQPDGGKKFDDTLDLSTMYGVMMFGLYTDSAPLLSTVSEIERVLLDKSPSQGVPRYLYDGYFAANPPHLGNPWIITTLWLAQFYIRSHDHEKAKHMVSWAIGHSYPSGVLPEQVNPSDGSPVSVAPLVWSHAELINTILDLSNSTGK